MSIRTGLLVICTAVFVLISGSLYVAFHALGTQAEIARAESRRYRSYQLADEQRQRSDDLTRMARLYVVTGEPRYKEYFDEILAIRDGEAPRPLDYGNVYWDFVVAQGTAPRRAGQAAALDKLMREARFTDDELALLRQSKSRSDALAALEVRAMQAAQGHFPDAQGRFTVVGRPDPEMARRMMHGQDYHRAKAEIMAPIHDVLTQVDSRTAAEVLQLRRRGHRLNLVVIVGLGAAVALALVSFGLIARYPFAGGGATPAAPRGRMFGLTIWTAWPLVAATLVACGLVLGLSWWLRENVEDHTREDIRKTLEATHRAAVRSVDEWLARLETEARAWARSPLLRGLFAAPGTRASSAVLGELLAPLTTASGFLGVLLVDGSGRVVASDDPQVGGQSLGAGFMAALAPALDRSPDHVLVVPPGETPSFLRELLVAATVVDRSDHAEGVLVLRFDPRVDLSRMLQRGRLGDSGESYAFDRSGRRISERHSGDGHGRGVDDAASRAAPRTRMTRAALAGRSGLDLDGYRDDRGVAVVGGWTWSERYGIGIATEIPQDEAFAAFSDYRSQSRAGTGLSLVLIVGLSGIFAWSRSAMAEAGAGLETAYEIIRGHTERMDEELQVAHDLQLSMMPRPAPPLSGRGRGSVYATLRPAREVGGDFYDFSFVDDTHLFFCVGDVSDKGVPAALFMAVAKTLISTHSAGIASTGALVTRVGADLGKDNERCMFVTLFVGRLDTATGELVYTNAGHEPPFLKAADGSLLRLDERHGPLVGVAPDVVYGESRRLLGPGDVLVVYTDGVTEARDAGGRLFSEDRLEGLLRAADAPATIQTLVDRIVAAAEDFERGAERTDDITVLALDARRPGGAGLALAERVILGAGPDDLDALDAALDGFGRRGGLAPAILATLRTVCDEIVSNVFAHGYPDGGERHVEVRLELAEARVVVTVCDDGIPFDPLAVPAPDTTAPLERREVGGLGIHLVRSLVDGATYARRGNRNVLTLEKDVRS